MKPIKSCALLMILLTSCGPTYFSTRTGYGYGPGYSTARPYYGNGYRPHRYYSRPLVIVQRRTYVVPAPRYRNQPSARVGNNRGYSSRSYGPRGGSRGPK